MANVRCFLYNNIPGTHPSWTVAMQAVSRKDSDNAIKAHWGGGKFMKELMPGKIDANCGDVSDAAGAVLRAFDE